LPGIASPIQSSIVIRDTGRFVRPELDRSIEPDDGAVRFVAQAYHAMPAWNG